MPVKLFFVIAGLTVVFFLVGLYLGGWVWLWLCDDRMVSPNLMTLLQQGTLSLTDKRKMMLPWAWCVTAAITFLPVGFSLLAFFSGGKNRGDNLHGEARFATKNELRKIWYTGPEK